MLDVRVLYAGLETPSTPRRDGRKITQITPSEHQRMDLTDEEINGNPIEMTVKGQTQAGVL